VVFRLGIAPTRAAARQLVTHCHVVVNGEVVNVPSFQVKSGMTIGVRERSKALEVIINSVGRQSRYSWVEWDASSMTGKFLNLPERSEIPENIKEQLIVELYSK
jgi:small subunit ribosomal protein S4